MVHLLFWDPFLLAGAEATETQAANPSLVRESRSSLARNSLAVYVKGCWECILCFRVVGSLGLVLFNRTTIFLPAS